MNPSCTGRVPHLRGAYVPVKEDKHSLFMSLLLSLIGPVGEPAELPPTRQDEPETLWGLTGTGMSYALPSEWVHYA